MESIFGAHAHKVLKPQAMFIWRGGPRYQHCNNSYGCTPRRLAECDIITWQAPNGQQMATYVMAPCPSCGYTMPIKTGSTVSFEQGRLTVRGLLQCPAHWKAVDQAGRETGETLRCGWQGVIRGGHAHHPKCPHADFNQALTPSDWQSCKCGGCISDNDKEVESDELARTGSVI